MLKNKKIIVAVTASVAAYKSIELIRELRKQGASVRVITTPDALRFVTPLSLETASGNEVASDLFTRPMSHIDLPQWAEAMIVAPLTANTISKFAAGSASDMVSACFLAFQGPVVIAPSMNWRMYTDSILQDRLAYVRARKNVTEAVPESGNLACGEEGIGRMASLDTILAEAGRVLSQRDLAGKKVVVTAGPTREYLDPVRFISNRSSGKMGLALAKCAYLRGAEVVLIAGPVSVPIPGQFRVERVETANEMRSAVLENVSGSDIFIMAAAVADYSPAGKEDSKISKQPRLILNLAATPDIISEISRLEKKPLVIGFAAETGDNHARAKEKMHKKGMDMIVFNNVSLIGSGFDTDTNQVVIIERNSQQEFPLMSKDEVAGVILDRAVRMIS